MTLRRQRVLVEQGPVTVFADLLGALDPVHRSPAAARAAGFAAPPVPPTYPFVMAQWGAHADLQPPADGDDTGSGGEVIADLTELSERMAAEGGMMLHGEQEFDYHRPLLVGEVVDVRSVLSQVGRKTNRAGRPMTVVTVTSEVSDLAGDPVLT